MSKTRVKALLKALFIGWATAIGMGIFMSLVQGIPMTSDFAVKRFALLLAVWTVLPCCAFLVFRSND